MLITIVVLNFYFYHVFDGWLCKKKSNCAPLPEGHQALGIDMKLITADQAYHDSDGSILEETAVYVIAPPSEKAVLPDNVLESPVRVTCNDLCEIPIKILGSSQDGHEFRCVVNPSECVFESACTKSRTIAFDTGYFQPMPTFHYSAVR